MRKFILTAFLFIATLSGAQTVQISDTLYNANGTAASGRIIVSAGTPFTASDGTAVGLGVIQYTIPSTGVINLSLYANVGATPSGTSYQARYVLTSGAQYTETWVVPASGPVTISAIRVSTVPSPTVLFLPTQASAVDSPADEECLTYEVTGTKFEWQTCGSGGGGSGLLTLNGLTADPQLFAVGTAGTDFAISSASDTHTFNIPSASATARGLVTTGTQTFAGAKTFSSTITGSISGNAGTATALAADPANCSAGQAAGGVTAAGVAESCLDPIVSTEIDTVAELAGVLTDEDFTPGSEASAEGVLDLQDLQGAVTDGQVPNNITVDLATVATTANAGDSATAFFSAGTIEDARIDGSAEADELVLAGDVDGTANANDLDEAAVESELEAVLDLADLQGDLALGTKTSGNYVDDITAGTGIAVTHTPSEGSDAAVALDYSDAGASPVLGADQCRLTSNATANGNVVCEGDTADTIETRIHVIDPTSSDKTFTIPNADSVAVQPLTCTGTEKVSAVSALGVVTCSADETGAGGGDAITVNTAAVSDPDFIDSTTVSVDENTGATPDEIAWNVVSDSIDATHVDETDQFALSNAANTFVGASYTGPTADPADSGILRGSNAEALVCAEASAAGTDVCLSVDSNEVFQVTGGKLDGGDLSDASVGATQLGTDSVSADELNATGVESELEAVLEHDELQGFVANEHVDHSGVTLTAGAGLSGGGDITASRSFATASGEADFLASGALTCGAGTQGKAQVHTTPLQYCDNAGTPALQYAAYGASDGDALAGDSATGFFPDQNAGTDLTADLEEEAHVTEHAENGADELLGEALGTACSENQILKANATGGLDCATDESAGSPTWDTIGDASGDGSIDLVGTEQDIIAQNDTANDEILEITNQDADRANDVTILQLSDNDADDANAIYMRMVGDADGTPEVDYEFAQDEATFTKALVVPTEVYDATGWDGDNSVPTKDAVRDKIETISAGETDNTHEIPLINCAPRSTTLAGNAYPTVKALSGGANDIPVWVFTNDVESVIVCSFVVPPQIAGTPAAGVCLYMTAAGNPSGEVRMAISSLFLAAGESIDQAYTLDSAVDITLDTTAREVTRHCIDLTPAVAGSDLGFIRIFRDGDHANDDAAQDMELHQATFRVDMTL